MNGHHADCSRQSCTIGREIGFDKALELIADLYAALNEMDSFCETGMDGGEEHSYVGHHIMQDTLCMLEEARAFLSEHAEHE